MWSNLADSDGNGFNDGPTDPNNIGNFATGFYWSSTEYVSSDAWKQDFDDGDQVNLYKYYTGFVRSVRAF